MKTQRELYLIHYGVKHKSGRYPYGSGDRPYQHTNGKGAGHKIETSKKTYDNTYGTGEVNRHKISGGSKANENVDKYAENEDYVSADYFDSLGVDALNEYTNKGAEAAAEYLDKHLKTKYDFVINDEIWNDKIYGAEKYVTFFLKVYGNTNTYNTFGENDYTDEQYFEKIKKG